MHRIKQHIAFKIASLLLVLFFTLPSVVKLSHVFEHHHHEVCTGENTTHLHTLDLDCDFYKFNLSVSASIPEYAASIIDTKHTRAKIVSQYFFLSDYQRLHFSLRGPPQINLV